MRTPRATLGHLCKFDLVVAVLLFGLLGFTQSAKAQSTGIFIPTGKSSIGEGSCSATALRDGGVLFTGSRRGASEATAQSEIYDPKTGTFARTGSMISARCRQSATLLKDGRVLVAGGYSTDSSSILSSAEIYDPSTGTFQSTGDMITGQFDQTSILLGSGKVLITGGYRKLDPRHLAAAPDEVFDPVTGTFAKAGEPGWHHPTATLLADGRVLLVGGSMSFTETIAALYDPATGMFRTISSANLPQPLFGHSATLMANGEVLIVGGSEEYPDSSDADGEDTEASAELFDPLSATFKDAGRLARARAWHTATTLPGGKVLVSGGLCDGDCKLAELYDPAVGTFAAAGNMLDLSDGWAILLADGTVLLKQRSGSELYIPAPSAVSSASLISPLAPESLASFFGARLTMATASAGTPSPPTSLGGTSLSVRDSTGVERLARLLYVSPSQINFEVPSGTDPGGAVLDVIHGADRSHLVTAEVRGTAAGLFAFPDNKAAAYAVRVEADGSQTILPAGSSIVLDDRPVYLILFGTGIRNRSSLANVRCTIGGISVPVEYAGPSGGGVAGLDQVDVRLTSDVKASRDGRLVLTVDGVPTNTVLVDIRWAGELNTNTPQTRHDGRRDYPRQQAVGRN
jgi:uncharacterized protein (TIGR03437 family)